MLTVYRASAGAGKTHTLTGEYLKLLFTHPYAYRRILAVTFTNKATDEMKSRIIEELYNLASGKKSDYLEKLCSEYSKTESQIRKEAKQYLINILHDYAAFNISTIDRFFQQTMRAFTREVGLQGGYGIEMDQEMVLSEAIDNLLADLEKPESKDLLGWLLRFAEDKIENGGEWNLRKDIKALGREIFKESYKTFSEAVSEDIQDKNILEQYKAELLKIIHAVENEVKSLSEKALAILDEYALQTTDFKGGSRSPLNCLEKLRQGDMKEPSATFRGLADNREGCYTKTTDPSKIQIISCAFENGLNDCIKGINAIFSDMTAYYTAKEIIRYYYTLGILTDISHQVAAYRTEKNIMLIADTTELLNKVIDGSDTPFIYEKTGTGIDHYMIDEFQDTSGMQWTNFRPLVNESLANQYDNLIVGDVKQSIYRFRNSDWKLLDQQVHQDFMPSQVYEETLKDNWRSCRHIVEFNNTLFTLTPLLLQSIYNDAVDSSSLLEEEKKSYSEKIMSAYRACHQQVPTPFLDKEGYVDIQFIERDGERGGWKEEAMLRLPALLENLQDNGYSLKDIAILVRTNVEGAIVADTLLTYKEQHPSESYRYDIISDDALFVNSSPTVRFMVAILRFLKNPDDPANEQLALFSYMALTEKFNTDLVVKSFPEEIRKALLTLSRSSLYEIVEGIYRMFATWFPKNEQVFIQAFLDLVAEYAQKEIPDLSRFLKWWDESGYRKTVTTPDSQDAIRILTVHKSKGLGFKVVLIPFCDWEIDHKPTKPVILWCQPEQAPFNKLRLVPVRYNQQLSKTIFAKDYFQERLHAYIDNLNTLYVAFTRAKEELIVLSPRPAKIKEKTGEVEKIACIADLLWAGLHTPDEYMGGEKHFLSLPSYFNVDKGTFKLGNGWRPVGEKETQPKKIEEIAMKTFSSISPDERLQLRLTSKAFFYENEQMKYGKLMHDILSHIMTKKDILQSVEAHRSAGVINTEEAHWLITRLEEILSHPEVVNWYDGTGQVLNEVNILTNRGKTRRPDRVLINGDCVTVIDYKFGEQKNPHYQNQVKNYLRMIRQMGYKDVKGYLWYVEMQQIEPVSI